MRILHTVESYLPSRHGMQEVVTQLSENLVKLGHDVTIATSKNALRSGDTINGVKIVDFEIVGNDVLGIIGESDQYQSFLLSSNFDVVTNFAAQQWATDLALPILGKIKAKKIFVPTGFSALHNPSYSYYYVKMKNWMKHYDHTVFLSNHYRDINFARDNGIKKFTIIPNGANEYEFSAAKSLDIRKKLKLSPDTKLILTVGSHTGYKGHDAAIEIFKKSNISNSVLLIVGNVTTSGGATVNLIKRLLSLTNFKRTNCSFKCKISAAKFNFTRKTKSIVVGDFDRETTINAYQQADVFLFPSLIECSPIVLFEAMASKTPFLVTDVGNAKEIVEWSKGGAILPTCFDKKGFSHALIDKSADMLVDFFEDEGNRVILSNNGYKSFLEKFTWQKIAKQYEKLYLKLIR